MKILHVITSLKIGGAESALVNYLEKDCKSLDTPALALSAHKVRVSKGTPALGMSAIHYVAYFYPGPNLEKIENLNIKTFNISGRYFKYSIFSFLKLKKIIKEIKPDIIHSALWTSNIYARIIGKIFNIPVLCDLHSNFSCDGKIRAFLEKPFLYLPATYVAVSSTAQDGFKDLIKNKIKNKNLRDSLEKKLFLIPNGIDYEKLREKAFREKLTKQDLNIPENSFVIGAIGRLEPIKSYDVLIRAFKIFNQDIKNSVLVLIGDGSQKTSLEKLALELNIKDNIIFTGYRTDAYRFYPIFDCFAISSQSEGMSIAILEALSFGLPVITTHRYKTHDLIENNKNGFIVSVNNYQEFAEKLKKLYLILFSKKGMCCNYSLDLIKDKFSIERTVYSYEKLYKNLLEKKFDF